jgi:uncharacterized repeat protein (TIGR04052 family)
MQTKLAMGVILSCGLLALGCGEDDESDAMGDAAPASTTEDAATTEGAADEDAATDPENTESAVTETDAGPDAASEPIAIELDAGAEPDASSHMHSVEIAFEARVGSATFSCDSSYSGLGTTAGLMSRVTDFRFYVADVELTRADGTSVPVELTQGGAWQYRNVALLDFEDRKGTCAGTGTNEVNTTIYGKVPHGSFSGLTFTVGVPEEFNHLDTAGRDTPSPLNIQAMAWNWASGRKFFRLDLSSTASGDGGVPTDAGKFVVHLGSTFCPMMGQPDAGVPGSCKNSNRPEITLNNFDPEKSKVVVDLAAVVAGSALNFNTPMTATGCMSAANDPECGAVFAQFGLALATGTSDPAHPQAVFQAASK